MACKMRLQRSKYTTPALVSVSLRVVRVMSLTPKCSSSAAMRRVTTERGHAQLVSGGGKAAQIGHPDKVLHGIEAAHCCYPGNKVLAIVLYFFKVESSIVSTLFNCYRCDLCLCSTPFRSLRCHCQTLALADGADDFLPVGLGLLHARLAAVAAKIAVLFLAQMGWGDGIFLGVVFIGGPPTNRRLCLAT